MANGKVSKGAPHSKRAPHSRSGCATCRRRRVRCDERKDNCANCDRLGLSCSWYQPADLLQRSRVNAACLRCRTKKIRCTSTSGGKPCEPCKSARVICTNDSQSSLAGSSKEDSDDASTAATAANAVSGQLPGRTELRRLLDAYFDGPHYHCFYSFIHKPTFVQMFESDLLPKFLLFIIIATSLHFLEPQNCLADQWANECRRLVMLEIFSPPSTTTLQALLLLQRYEWHRASHVSAWFISGLAVRLAHGLQLNIEILDTARVPATIRETRRRLMWSCFIMDSLIEGGRRPLSGLEASSIEVKLPCNESSFQLGLETNIPDLQQIYDPSFSLPQTAGSSSSLLPENSLGISAFLVKLAELRRDILRWTLAYHPRNKGHFPSESPWALASPFFRFEAELEKWYAHLPEELRFNAEVMNRRRSRLVSFVTVHCLFHGCFCDLYRIGSYLTAYQRQSSPDFASWVPPLSFLAICRRGRLQNALSICKIISQSMELDSWGHDPVVGISAALAIRVLVIERQLGDSEALSLTDQTVYRSLEPAVRCAKWIAQRSLPIRDLFCSICALAKQRGLDVDLSGIPTGSTHSIAGRQEEPERESSPSLRTYGTFGSIQTSLAMRGDVHALAASSSTDKESDIFNNLEGVPAAPQQPQGRGAQAQNDMVGLYDPSWNAYLPGESFSPSGLAIASGWGDGTLNFSMMPLQSDWINQSLGFDFDNDETYDVPQTMW